MTKERFDDLTGKTFHECKKTLIERATQYATKDDRLHNFKAGCAKIGLTPQKYAQALMTKQMQSLDDMIDGKILPTTELLEEKCKDIINYIALIKAIFTENMEELKVTHIDQTK